MKKIQQDVNLLPYNTFKVSSKTKFFQQIDSPNDLDNLPVDKTLILGQGANVLFTKDFDGLVLRNHLKGKKIIKEDKDHVYIEAASGEDWIDLVNWTTDNSWSGIENLAYIPGTVGAAPVQNLAAYGQNFGESVVSITGVNLKNNKTETLSNKDCKLYYRDSIFKHELKDNFFITKVAFRLSKKPKFDLNYFGSRPYESLKAEIDRIAKPPYTPAIIAKAVTNQRKVKMPDWKNLGTVGSIFKNPFVSSQKLSDLQSEVKDLQVYPVNAMLYPNHDDPVLKMQNRYKIPVGKLLDELGWRGKRIGNVGTYEKHALVVVNFGGATGQEILDFINLMKTDIQKNFEIDPELEVNVI